MILQPFLTSFASDQDVIASLKLKESNEQEYQAFADTTRQQLRNSLFKSQSSASSHGHIEGLVKQLDATISQRHLKEKELVRLSQELNSLQRSTPTQTTPRNLMKIVEQLRQKNKRMGRDVESYLYLKDRTEKNLQITKEKACQLERQVQHVGRRLTESTDDMNAVSTALGQELSQLYLIEERTSRLKNEQTHLLQAEHRAMNSEHETMKQQEQTFIMKKFLIRDARKHIMDLRARLAELKANRSSILMQKVVCIMLISRAKQRNRMLTDSFGSCLPEDVIAKFEEFSTLIESFKHAIDDKVNCLWELQRRKNSYERILLGVMQDLSKSSIKSRQIAKSKQDILVNSELVKKKRANDHLIALHERAEGVMTLAFNSVNAIQALLKKVDTIDTYRLLGPKVEFQTDLPQILANDDLNMLISILTKKLIMVIAITGQRTSKVKFFKMHNHLKAFKHRQTFRKTALKQKLGSYIVSETPSPIISSIVKGFAEVVSKDVSRTQNDVKMTISKIMSLTRHLDHSVDESAELDRKKLKQDLRKSKTNPKLKVLAKSPLASPRTLTWEERTMRQLVQIDKFRAELSHKTHTLSKPMSPQPREITRHLKHQLQKLTSVRVHTTLPNSRLIKSPLLSPR